MISFSLRIKINIDKYFLLFFLLKIGLDRIVNEYIKLNCISERERN